MFTCGKCLKERHHASAFEVEVVWRVCRGTAHKNASPDCHGFTEPSDTEVAPDMSYMQADAEPYTSMSRAWMTHSPPHPITSCAPLRSLAFRNIPLPSRCGGRLSRENGSGHAHRPATNRGWPCLWKRPNACLDVRHPKARSLSISQKMRSSLSPLRDQPVDKQGNVRPCQSVPVSVSELLKASW